MICLNENKFFIFFFSETYCEKEFIMFWKYEIYFKRSVGRLFWLSGGENNPRKELISFFFILLSFYYESFHGKLYFA